MMGNNDNGHRITIIIIIDSWLKDCGHLVNLHSKILCKNCKTVNVLIVFSISLNIFIYIHKKKKHVICIKQMVFNRNVFFYPSTTLGTVMEVDGMLVTNTLPADFSSEKS